MAIDKDPKIKFEKPLELYFQAPLNKCRLDALIYAY
jgi:hypothetical protein